MTDVDARARELARKVWPLASDEWIAFICPIIAAALHDYGAHLQSKLTAAESRVKELDAQATAMRHDLETSQGLYACDNAEGQSLFVLDHPSLKPPPAPAAE